MSDLIVRLKVAISLITLKYIDLTRVTLVLVFIGAFVLLLLFVLVFGLLFLSSLLITDSELIFLDKEAVLKKLEVGIHINLLRLNLVPLLTKGVIGAWESMENI